MDKIKLKNLRFYGYHGVLEEENKIGQKFIVDLDLLTDLKKPGQSDDVEDTINYALVYDIVRRIVENEQFNLIEKLAQEIVNEIFQSFEKVLEIEIEIKKPEAPVKGIYDYFSVQLRRKRDE